MPVHLISQKDICALYTDRTLIQCLSTTGKRSYWNLTLPTLYTSLLYIIYVLLCIHLCTTCREKVKTWQNKQSCPFGSQFLVTCVSWGTFKSDQEVYNPVIFFKKLIQKKIATLWNLTEWVTYFTIEIKWRIDSYIYWKVNLFYVAAHLFGTRLQMTSKQRVTKEQKSGMRWYPSVTDVIIFWHLLWSISEQMYGNMEYTCSDNKENKRMLRMSKSKNNLQ